MVNLDRNINVTPSAPCDPNDPSDPSDLSDPSDPSDLSDPSDPCKPLKMLCVQGGTIVIVCSLSGTTRKGHPVRRPARRQKMKQNPQQGNWRGAANMERRRVETLRLAKGRLLAEGGRLAPILKCTLQGVIRRGSKQTGGL